MTLADRLGAALEKGHASETRLTSGDFHNIPRDDLRPAAVLIAITDRPEPGVILTLRNAALRRHAGQVAFPGGRMDPEDASIADAALREAEEEIGLSRDQVTLVGTTDTWSTGTGFFITPVIGVVPPDLPLVPHEHEVAAIFEAPLAHLLDLASYARKETMFDGVPRTYMEAVWGGYRIWGATAGMLRNLARRLEGFL